MAVVDVNSVMHCTAVINTALHTITPGRAQGTGARLLPTPGLPGKLSAVLRILDLEAHACS